MSEEPISVSTDGLHAASEQAAMWERAVTRAERGETIAVLTHGQHVADVVPSGEIERLRETIDVLSDNDLLRDIYDGLQDLKTSTLVPADTVAADLRRRSIQE